MKRQLPYIEIKSPPLKLLIDSGANQSFLSPEIIEKYFKNIPLIFEPFSVTNLNCTTHNKYAIEIPTFPEFKENSVSKFYIYKFHNVFDGLIGYETLVKLKANVDFGNKLLQTPNCTIPLKILDSGIRNLFEALVRANSTKLVKLPVDTSCNSDIFIPSILINKCLIPASITRSENGYAYAEITNPTSVDTIVCLVSPLKVMSIPNNFDLYNIETFSNKTSEIESMIRTEHLNSEQKYHIIELCKKYTDIFHKENQPLTFTSTIKHRIKTTDEIPIYTRTYRYPYIHKAEVDSQIRKMLEQNIIRPSNSPWSSPIWIVPKKLDASGKAKWRLVVDYRKLNEKTIRDSYPIPNINDILDKLGRAQYFSVIDCASGFYQIEVHPDDVAKTAFNIGDGYRGHFEFLRMPMGLRNSPSTFQRCVDNILRGLKNVLVYMDDIIVFSTSLQEHIQDLENLFQRLREANLKIQLDKTEFMKRETPFLGHLVTTEGIKPDPNKVKAIKEFPIPRTTKEIKSFLGLLGYYRKFIPSFAQLTKPLTSCLKKGAKIELTPTYVNCFRHCQNLLMNDPILQYPDFSKEFLLRTDASNFALGAVLSQGPLGSDKPVAYASRTLNNSEINYSTVEKELLAIVWATKYFRPYLFGRPFTIITDHKPLQYLMNIKDNTNSRLTRWRLKLEEYDYKISYQSGKSNAIADSLSRIELQNNDTNNTDTPPTIDSNDEEIADRNLSMIVNQSDLPQLTDLDDLDNDTIHTAEENPVLEIPFSEKAINLFDNQLFIEFVHHSPSTPKTLEIFTGKKRILAQISEFNIETEVINLFKEFIKPNIKYGIYLSEPKFMPILSNTLRTTFKNSAYKLFYCKSKLEDIIDRDKQYRIIKNYHEGKTNHRGIQEVEQRIKLNYYWPNLKTCVAEFINNCEICQTCKYERRPNKQNFQIVPIPEKPFEILHIDTLTVNRVKFLTIIDVFSKYAQAYSLESLTGISVLNALTRFMSHHGIPLAITADQGTEFKNLPLKEFALLHKINLHFISVNNPQSNGAIERFHSTILEHIRILTKTRCELSTEELMLYAILGYNNSIHSVTKQKPIDVINGHTNSRDPFDIDVENVCLQSYVDRHKDVTKELYSALNKRLQENQTRTMKAINTDREPPLQYTENTAFYSKNPLAVRHKTKPRYIKRNVKQNLDIKVIDDRYVTFHKRNVRRPLRKQHTLLQDSSGSNDPEPGPSNRSDFPSEQSRDPSISTRISSDQED